ncbi:vesicular integral-membrane protein VIP36 [Morone saxatilis]|uniref:vesicular integral-membrane protein VIP36 n=1 Tax=Morone saxatilis TaxID=34816 RepID=UPI0015E22D58|nr:vesicular integral-membrane protein VIP36 [Morone saxatilis]
MGNFGAFLRRTAVFLLLQLCVVCCDITDGNTEHLKREHSLMKPYQVCPSSQLSVLSADHRNVSQVVRSLSHLISASILGPVFGNQDQYLGLALFLDTFRNDLHGMDRSFPYISAMVNNGSVSYDHGKDGRSSELGGCSAEIRNREHDTYLAIRYSKGRLTVMVDVDDKNEWKECIDIGGVRLPTGYFFGASAATGDLSGKSGLESYTITHTRTKHSSTNHTSDPGFSSPFTDNIDDPTGNFRGTPLTGWKVFLLLLCALLGIVVCAVVGAVVFQKRQERNKRFY